MKTHTTNYFDTFIEVAEDTGAIVGTKPPARANKSIAEMQYELIAENPYRYTSDEVCFLIFATRNKVPASELEEAKARFFAKGQPCLRTSPLPKTYGFGIHFDSCGRIALYGVETAEYLRFLNDSGVKKVKAMRVGK